MSEDISGVLRRPWDFFKFVVNDHKKWLFLAVFLVIFASVLSATSNYFFQLIVDSASVGEVNKSFMYGILYPVTILVVQVLFRFSGYAASKLTTRVSKEATDTLFIYLLKHSRHYYSNRFAGSVTSKIRNVTSALEGIIPDFLWSQLASTASFFSVFIMIFFVDKYVAVLFLLLLVSLFLINKSMAEEKARVSKENALASTKLQGGLSDVMSNISIVQLYAKSHYEVTRLKDLTNQKLLTSSTNWLYTEKLLLINVIVVFAYALLMFWLLTMQWSIGSVSNGQYILVLALVSQITGTMVFIGRAVNATARAVGELREGLEDIYVPYDITDKQEAGHLVVTGGSVELTDVTFKYETNIVFDRLNLFIPARQRVGLVGPSGAGKSTLVSLLLRQYDVTAGSIRIDGINIAEVTQDSLREAVAVVPQEPALFHRSIRDNIAYGNPLATEAEIQRAAELAQAHEFIMSLPLGYDTLVGERGVKLSGGQKQRVAIARAMLKNAPVLILDEATSALDSESEHLIQQALHELMRGKTVIAIAHRLSTLREMDRVIVLDQGRIMEDGTHQTLQKAGGIYERLWTHQAGGFLLE